MTQSERLRGFISDISKAVQSFAGQEAAGKQELNRLAGADPVLFFAAGIRVLASAQPSEGSQYLIQTMAKDKRLSIGLLDPNVCTIQQAVAVTRAAAEAGAKLQATFEMALNKALQSHTSPDSTERILRILDILAATSDQSCWNSFQVELMAYPDKMVRSKAALLIGRSTRNVAWIARRLLDRDPRVQASAVEALWGLNAEEARPHFLAALKSSNNRVAANAALGLYWSGDASAVRVLLDMLRGADPALQISALWAIGETKDERFLPALTEYYKQAAGKQRLATVGAMSKIRRDKPAKPAGPLQIHISQAALQADGLRRLVFALSCHPARDLSHIKPNEFTVWEDGSLIENYQVRLASPPAVLMAGFVAPWFASVDDPYEKALREGFAQCLAMKRRDDLWRIDRYSVEMNPASAQGPAESLLPYDDSLITPELKAGYGCLSDTGLLGKLIGMTAPHERAALDPLAAIQRQCDAFAKHGGKRHVFFFLHDMSGFDLKQDAALQRLRGIAQESSAVLHGICPDVAGQWSLLRDLCLSNPEGTFIQRKLDGLIDALVDVYANLSSRFEVSYSLPDHSAESEAPAKVKLRTSSSFGNGECEIVLDRAPAPAPPEPQAASIPAPEAPQPV